MNKYYHFLVCATVFLAFLGMGVSPLRAQNTQGKEFWLTFGRNQSALYGNIDLQIRIANGSQATNVTIEFINLKTSHSFSVGAQQVYLYDLSEPEKQAVYNDVPGVSDRSIHITTDHPVTVYALNSGKNSGAFTDVTNVFPVTNLGTEYYQISYMPYDYSDAYAVIGIENNTVLFHDGIVAATIDVGEVYYRTSPTDMTGAHITTNKPVAFFAVNQMAQVPANVWIYDILIHQLAPVKTWGKNFFVPVSTQGKNIVRIVASQNGTNIMQTGGTQLFPAGGQTSLTNLKAGDFVELEVNLANNGCYIQADKPVGVCAYLPSSFYTSPVSGDPAQSWLPAIEQTITEALIAPFIRSTIDNHYAIVVTSFSTKNDTRVSIGGGAPALLNGGSWVDNAAAGMSFYTMPLTNFNASYLFTNPKGVIIMCYGLGGASSYYYLAGSALRDLTAAFFANNISYLDLKDHLFCENDIEFHAVAEETGTVTIDSLKWYIDGTEHLPAQNAYTWNHTFSAGNYLITLKVYADYNETLTFEGNLHIGAHISTTASPATGGTTTPVNACIKVGEPVTLTATPNPNYMFQNWTDTNGAIVSPNATFSLTVMSDSALVANFALNPDAYIITVSANPETCGTVTGGGIFNYEETATVVATALNDCCVFMNWTEDDIPVSNNAEYTFVVTKNRDLVANFEQQTRNLALYANPPEGGIVIGSGDHPCGDDVTATAIPTAGYVFVNWTEYGDVVSPNPDFTFPLMTSRILVANFAPEAYAITVIANPTAGGTVGGGGMYHLDDFVTVKATPAPTYRFINWTEDDEWVSDDAEYSFTVTESRTLVANFDKRFYEVIADVNGTGYGYTIGSGMYASGDTARVEVVVDNCYRFANWTIEGKVVSTSKLYAFEVTKDVTVTANIYVLDFDTYAPTLWHNTFMLNLKRLKEEGYKVVGCEWYKNGDLEPDTRTIDDFSYSAGPKKTDLLEPAPTWYMFKLFTTSHGPLCSTHKMLDDHPFYAAPDGDLTIYPNPALSGNSFTVEGVEEGCTVLVYNQYGICVRSVIVTGNPFTLTLDNVQAGTYLIRVDGKQGKVVVIP